MYDTIIVGGGPAGLTEAIHLAWHDRKVLVIDRRSGPLFFTLETLQNVPGMPAVRGSGGEAGGAWVVGGGGGNWRVKGAR